MTWALRDLHNFVKQCTALSPLESAREFRHTSQAERTLESNLGTFLPMMLALLEGKQTAVTDYIQVKSWDAYTPRDLQGVAIPGAESSTAWMEDHPHVVSSRMVELHIRNTETMLSSLQGGSKFTMTPSSMSQMSDAHIDLIYGLMKALKRCHHLHARVRGGEREVWKGMRVLVGGKVATVHRVTYHIGQWNIAVGGVGNEKPLSPADYQHVPGDPFYNMNALAAAVKEQGGDRVAYAGPNKFQEFCVLQGEDSWDDLLTVARSMIVDLTPFEI